MTSAKPCISDIMAEIPTNASSLQFSIDNLIQTLDGLSPRQTRYLNMVLHHVKLPWYFDHRMYGTLKGDHAFITDPRAFLEYVTTHHTPAATFQNFTALLHPDTRAQEDDQAVILEPAEEITTRGPIRAFRRLQPMQVCGPVCRHRRDRVVRPSRVDDAVELDPPGETLFMIVAEEWASNTTNIPLRWKLSGARRGLPDCFLAADFAQLMVYLHHIREKCQHLQDKAPSLRALRHLRVRTVYGDLEWNVLLSLDGAEDEDSKKRLTELLTSTRVRRQEHIEWMVQFVETLLEWIRGFELMHGDFEEDNVNYNSPPTQDQLESMKVLLMTTNPSLLSDGGATELRYPGNHR